MQISWKAHYNDKTSLVCSDLPGGKDYYKIDRTKLKSFELYDKDTGKTIFTMPLKPDQRLIYRRRVHQDFHTGEIQKVIYLVGWQKTVNGKNVQSIAHIYEDGKIELKDRWEGGEPEYHESEL
jgi:hypothetical protein